MTVTTSLTINGLWDYEGDTVVAYIAGLDCGSFTVSSGTIAVPYGSDPDGSLTADYLKTISDAEPAGGWGPNGVSFDVYISGTTFTKVTVPCSVGFPYAAQAQRLRPLAPDQTKTQSGPALGMTRRVDQYAAHIVSGVAGTTSFGTDPAFATNMTVANFAGANGVVLTDTETFSGIHHDFIEDGLSFDGALGWTTSDPQPLVIAAVTSFVTVDERT